MKLGLQINVAFGATFQNKLALIDNANMLELPKHDLKSEKTQQDTFVIHS